MRVAAALIGLALGLGLGGDHASAEPVDRDQLRREAAAMPAVELEARLASPVRAVRLAAIAGAPAAPDAGDLLDELAGAAAGWDRSVAVAAARAGRAIARGLIGGQGAPVTAGPGPARGEPAALDPDDAAAAEAAWLAVARDRRRWADVRVHALEVVVALAAWRREAGGGAEPGYDLEGLGLDVDPEVRRAALELVPVPVAPDARGFLVRQLTDERAVALAAAQALCADLPRDAAAVLVALGPDGLARLRELVAPGAAPRVAGVVEPLPGAAELDVARCLAADGDPASRRALEALRQRLPRALRATLAAVTADVGARARR